MADDGRNGRVCPVCGSSKWIPDVTVIDYTGDGGSQPAEVRVSRRPLAFIFRGSEIGHLLVDICGECGHAELRVTNYRELYDAYRTSLADREPRTD